MTEEISTRQPTYSIGEFEGPLDLLLFLIRKNEVNIYDIPIADITQQYLDYLATAESDLDDMTEFCVMASTLLYIKSCLLLPEGIDVDDDTEDPRTELVERLIEYQKHKSLGQLIASKQAEADWLPARREREIELLHPEKEMWEEVAVWDLLKAFSTLVSSISMERIIDLHEEMTVNEIVKAIGLSQPTISRHLAILREAEVVIDRRDGQQVFYSLNKSSVENCCSGFCDCLAVTIKIPKKHRKK